MAEEEYPWKQFRKNGKAHYIIHETKNENNCPKFLTACSKFFIAYSWRCYQDMPPIDKVCEYCKFYHDTYFKEEN